jgi:glycosyltransferase involved in cell wall biosynthesis
MTNGQNNNLTSVVITCHNYGRYLKQSIDSVIRQTKKPLEIIVINDSSNDETEKVVTNYGDNVSYIYVDYRNVQKARNDGLKKAKGKYIVYLDADDYFRDDFIEKMEREMENDSSLSLVYSDRINFGNKDLLARLNLKEKWETSNFDYSNLIKDNYISLPSLIRREHFSGFDENINISQDWEAWLTLLKHGKAKRIAEPLFYVRIHGENKTFVMDGYTERIKILAKHKLYSILVNDFNKLRCEIKDNNQKIQSKDIDILQKKTEIKLIEQEIITCRLALDNINLEKKLIQNELNINKDQLNSQKIELIRIYSCRGWRMIVFLRKFIEIIIPRHSFRRKVAYFLFKLCNRAVKIFYSLPSIKNKLFLILRKEGIIVLIRKIINKILYYFVTPEKINFNRKIRPINDRLYFEEQEDYSSEIKHKNIKILSYYLPQFHTIPENDEWHGKGFTEWSNVKKASQLFYGHYQPHCPHKDIGYYILNSPVVLKKQAEMMIKAGVFGQIFYHYWFTGKLILEKPAQMLLNNKEINMPFCFCWANENWTRKWDGNEKEILLQQNYSKEDALNFIKYLVPYLKDERYIKIDGRPVLFIYRLSSFPDFNLYKDIWEKECKKNGIQNLYLVATLTRGTTSPLDYGMDAGAERVLHDWTNGKVSETKNSLDQYVPINGSVLKYNDVAEYYMSQKDKKDFTYFRSIVPIWDNTARYGNDAYLLHGSTPAKFQNWMESIIKYTESVLPEDKQIIIVNAWNEWAEGAHLEPDSEFGYAYLNSIGRALSDNNFDKIDRKFLVSKDISMKIEVSADALKILEDNKDVRKKFISCLANSTLFSLCKIIISDKKVVDYLKDSNNQALIYPSGHFDYKLLIDSINYFDTHMIEQLLIMGLFYKHYIICANDIFSNKGSLNNKDVSPIRLYPNVKNIKKTFRVCPKAVISMAVSNVSSSKDKLPVVTTIIRFHKDADFELLNNALLSILSQNDCIVQPLITTQDLSNDQMNTLNKMVYQYPWSEDFKPIIKEFCSSKLNNDLRSKMLNIALISVKTKYAAFLDFDDVLFPFAYKYLIDRLVKTNKAVSFGNVFTTLFSRERMSVIERKKEYVNGKDYESFFYNNHAPLHSFMLDIEKINLRDIKYFDDMKFMEDYYLTLQLFTRKNTDWESLKIKKYIGDYIHSIDSKHTLAFLNDNARLAITQNSLYILCEKRINDLRERIESEDKNIYE